MFTVAGKDNLASTIRRIADDPARRTTMVEEEIKRTKELQRKNLQEYESTVSSLLICLENFDVVQSDTPEITCALTVLDILLRLDLTTIQMSQCSSYARLCLCAVSDTSIAPAAARTFAETLVNSMTSDFARMEIDETLSWIELPDASMRARRICGLLVLQQVALRIPMLILPKLGTLCEKLWSGLASSDDMIRDTSAQLFKVCGKLLSNRSPTLRIKTVDTLLSQLKSNLAAKSRESNLAGLLAFETVVMSSMGGSSQPRYEDLSIMLVPYIMSGGSSANSELVRKLLFHCLVVLCRYNTTLFIINHLKDTVSFALKSIQNLFQHCTAFDMLSEIIPMVGKAAFTPFVKETCEAVCFISEMSPTPCWESLKCFSVIFRECPPPDVESYIEPCIENVFNWGLSSQLIECMRDIISLSSIKGRTKLEEALLDMISVTLCGLPFRQVAGTRIKTGNHPDSEPTESQIVVALNALIQFGFSDSELMGDFLRDSVLPLIDSPSACVRNAAVNTIVSLLIPPGIKGELTMSRRICVDMIVSRMLVVGLANPDPVIRATILSSFTQSFYPYLSELQFLTQLFSALGDEDICCRIAATGLLCRMVNHYPSHILPILRKEILHILYTLSSEDTGNKVSNGLLLLDAVASNAPQFVVNLTDGIIKVLGRHLSSLEVNSPILQSLLRCCTSVARAVRFFGHNEPIFTLEVERVCELLDLLPLDTEFVASRLWCLRFIGATLGPQIGGRSPYDVYPQLYRRLSGILKNSDDDLDLRLEALRCAGTIGVLDTRVFQSLGLGQSTQQTKLERNNSHTLSHAMCCRHVLRAIASLLDPDEKRVSVSKDSLLRVGIQTVLHIGECCPCSRAGMAVVIPAIVRAASELSPGRLLGIVLHELAQIVKCVGPTSLSDVATLHTFCDVAWERCPVYRFLVVRLASTIASLREKGDQKYLQSDARVLPITLDALNDSDSSEYLQYAILEYIVKHTETLQFCAEIVVLDLLRATQRNPIEFGVYAVTALRTVCTTLNVDELTGVIVRGLLAALKMHSAILMQDTEYTSFTNRIMSVFCVLIVQLQGEFIKYSSQVIRTLKTLRISNAEFTTLQGLLLKGVPCTLSASLLAEYHAQVVSLLKKCELMMTRGISYLGEVWSARNNVEDAAVVFSDDERPLPLAEQRIINTLKTTPLTKEEWLRWIDQFSISVMQESPYRVFRCVSLPIGTNATPLVERSPEFTQDILRLAFRALWNFGSASIRSSIVDFFRQTLQRPTWSSTVPDDFITAMLSLVEYMDVVGMTLPIAANDLSECAWSRGMLAKALYWREAAYREDPASTIESLTILYSELHQPDSAVSLLGGASESQKRYLLQQSEILRLPGYTEALCLTQEEIDRDMMGSETSSESFAKLLPYRSKNLRRFCGVAGRYHPDVSTFFRGEDTTVDLQLEQRVRQMMSLSEFGDYDKVLQQWGVIFNQYKGKKVDTEENILFYVSQYAADASIRLQSWGTLEDALLWMPKDSVHYYISRAALSIHKGQYDEASLAVNEGRKLLLDDLAGLLHESYIRAYESLVIAQELSELEEVVAAQRVKETVSTQHLCSISRLWSQRILMMSPTVPVWKQVLSVRGLLIPPSEDVTTQLRFVKLCRRANAKQLERFTLLQLLGSRCPTYEQLMSHNANPRVVMQYIGFLSANGELGPNGPYGLESDLLRKLIDTHSKVENATLLSRAYVRLGTKAELWEAIECYKAATLYDPNWFHAWRMCAEANVELLNTNYSDAAYAAAIEGYIKSIKLGISDSTMIQDVLKLLTLLSRPSDSEDGLRKLREKVLEVSSRAWYLVVPQLIARLDSGSDESCQLIADILTPVAFDYPISLLYPLNLSAMSDSERRKKLAHMILEKLKSKFPVIVLQGRLVIDELLRISDLVYEKWYDQLDAAANAFFGRRHYHEMVENLLLLHEELHRAPETIVEAEFTCKYSSSLQEAQEWLQSYKRTGSVADLHSAWHIYHCVYRQIDAHVRARNRLQLPFCSPKLFEARNLSVGIPDAMPTDEGSVSCIASFNDTLVVIASKQRPKRLSVITTEGKKQKYLLKGREDLRLDERVMQLFRLVNSLMMSDSRACKNSGFQIKRYSVTPLKDTVGIIGWVSGCDTLHELVKKYRTYRGVPAELELRMLNQIIVFDQPRAYDFLTVMSKVEVMEFLADHTTGHDIRKAMWTSAASCETWLEQRQEFTTSLAATSMVGYILGLGDRHPNNIMIQRTSGLMVHIDFGDCFEVGMTRDKFPEKVPFRLTRMLRNALDVSGVDGAFRTRAEVAMCVLRDGSHSVLAILEAFIQDPLISWRLLNRPGEEPQSSAEHHTFEQMRPRKLYSPAVFRGKPPADSVSTEAVRTAHHASVREEVDMTHKGVTIFGRVRSKLKGEDFMQTALASASMDPKAQVARLIVEATDITNVAQSWSGWYPFW
ncbi:peroxidase/phosphatidylinositol 3-kinase/serine/threonine-protein kinase HSL1,negative regulator of Swe1 kinase [Trypanosoma rangeli]|uniref:Serine/threonine-protein kinase TOR n=1 Tax=Trypanosoma rangeli TaxID=5698 RepID=A0A3R7RDN2_TRYRA|nr:peroxidase/phosphatidylinositol 3-kinase/serine/threonine-protein kinase HSL1,negative regulator of Swe1 kinase [Trypanosoma rangeli]RNF00505.1 peroxidase/phosphatidylinositol 3-kinase/serine/threonine-protein kinase HSL1,negative regulator of Swe1 kinase [Trypanosoma rangeli]|eukprot:RNF00505.1 peroxidase/phosphatidylinositol 3-kinase/serine/threonine-protein kinase HSL1,negative regulator of Swe1 kinase [Trypanosoma rangeli]